MTNNTKTTTPCCLYYNQGDKKYIYIKLKVNTRKGVREMKERKKRKEKKNCMWATKITTESSKIDTPTYN